MPKRILIIDDEKLITMTLKRLLTKEGYHVTPALSGKAAIKQIEQSDFDMIIADIKMPEMDGIETVKKIREILTASGRKLIPEIFITGYASDENFQEAQRLNVVDYVEKPFDIKSLMQAVEKASKIQQPIESRP